MQVTVEKILGLQAGLQHLDALYDKIIEDGRNSKKVVSVRYDLSKKTRIENSMRLDVLGKHIAHYQKLRVELIQKYGEAVGDDFNVPGKNALAFNKENRELLDAEIEIDVLELHFDELKLDDNPIPGSVLALLMPIRADGPDSVA